MLCRLAIAAVLAASSFALAQPLSTAFTFQGQLDNAGTPVSGTYDFKFKLFDAPSGGAQQGPELCSDNIAVTGGKVTVQLDFGAQFAGSQRFLEVQVRPDTGLNCANATGFTTLAPRQSLTAAPNAVFSLNAGAASTAASATNATQLNGQAASFYQNAANLNTGTLPSARLSGTYSSALTLSNGSNAFTGSGAALTALNATNIASGTLSTSRLPIPLSLSGSNDGGGIFNGINASTTGWGVFGTASSPTGSTYGGRFESSSTDGRGVFGYANASSGNTYGVYGLCNSPAGRGVFGWNGATTGINYGVYGQADSNQGTGVYGTGLIGVYGLGHGPGTTTGVFGYVNSPSAPILSYGVWGMTDTLYGTGVLGRALSPTGSTYGGKFDSVSPDGVGVQAVASASSGSTLAVYARCDSTGGTGVYGLTTATTGSTNGVYGESASPDGRGTVGFATAGSGGTYGVSGVSNSTTGTGVYGYTPSASGTTIGVWGQSDGTGGTGVYGNATAGSGTTYGVHGLSVSTDGRAVFGEASASTGITYGGYFVSSSTSGYGTYSRGGLYGVYGRIDGTSGVGVLGQATATTGSAVGVEGLNPSPTGTGVHGLSGLGVFGQSTSTSGIGVYGWNAATSGVTYGVIGESDSPGGTAIRADAAATTGGTRALFATGSSPSGYAGYFQGPGADCVYINNTGGGRGLHIDASTGGGAIIVSATGFAGLESHTGRAAGGNGVYGVADATTGTNYGVVGQTSSPSGFGVFSNGTLGASGTKPFRIDHPADPQNKYLLHYSAESPEVINFYRGTAALDSAGEAVVELPAYFAAINTSPTYQLTAVGAPMPLLHVAAKISAADLEAGNAAEPGQPIPTVSFRIAGGAPNEEVSWEVKAARNDRWVQRHGAPVEVDKQDHEKGKYQHPDLYNQPPEKGMHYDATRISTRDPATPDTAPR